MSETVGFLDFINALDCCTRETFVSMLLEFLDSTPLEKLQSLVANLSYSPILKVEDDCVIARSLSNHGPSDVGYDERNREYAIEQQNSSLCCKIKLVNYFTSHYDHANEMRQLLLHYENLSLLLRYENEVAKANQMRA